MAENKKSFEIFTIRELKEQPYRKKVKLEGYLVGNNAPAVLICPGGAYKFISDFNEGRPYAAEFNKRGVNAFVLTYSVSAGARYPKPMLDVARALQYIKAHSSELEIEADKIALVGSSAGGHLCGFFASQYERFESEYEGKKYSLKPSSLILCYPVVTMGEFTHKVSRKYFLGFLPGKPEIRAASIENCITADYPPAFLWHCKDDASVDYHNSELLAEALKEHNVPYEFKLYETGGHGIGLAEGKEPEGWFQNAFDFIKPYMAKNII